MPRRRIGEGHKIPDGSPTYWDRFPRRKKNLDVRVGVPQVGPVQEGSPEGRSEGLLLKDDTRKSSDVRALRANPGTEFNMKLEDLLAKIPEYAGCGQGSPRSVLQHIFLGEGVPIVFGGVMCQDNIDNIKQLLTDLAQGDLRSYQQSSNRIKLAPPESEYEYDDFSEGTYLIRQRAFAFVSQVGPKIWSVSLDFVGGDLTEEEVKAFDDFRVREEAKRDPTKYQSIWMLIDHGNNTLDFHSKKVPLSEFKTENYSELNRQWLPRLRDALFKPTTTGRLTVLQGPPGTGKTRYLRALMQELGDGVCPVVLPVSLASDLSNPRMLGVLTGNRDFEKKKVLLIIEDGDGLIEKRERASSVISDFLNVVDGLIGEVIDLHIVVTTNLQKKDFDPAITRPGRLHSVLYFEALEYSQAASVYKRETGAELKKTQETYTLAEIYALAQDHHNGVRKKEAPTGQGQYL